MSFLSAGAGQLKRSVADGLHLTPLQRGLLFGALAVLALLPIIYLDVTPIPAEQNMTEGTAALYLATNNSRVIFPNQCLDVTWQVEGIKTVSINEQGRVGAGTEKICDTYRPLTMQVEMLDGSRKELIVEVEKLYREPLIAVLLVVGVVALTLVLYNLIGTWAALTALTIALTAPALLYFVVSEGKKWDAVDYSSHISIIQGMIDGSRPTPPHFLYHMLAIGWVNLFPGATLKDATVAILLIANILTCVAAYVIFRLITGERSDANWKWTLIYLAIPIILFIGPINFSSPFIIISSYVYPNPPHSPTFIFLKPFAVGFLPVSSLC